MLKYEVDIIILVMMIKLLFKTCTRTLQSHNNHEIWQQNCVNGNLLLVSVHRDPPIVFFSSYMVLSVSCIQINREFASDVFVKNHMTSNKTLHSRWRLFLFCFLPFFFTIADIISMSHFKYQHNIATNAKILEHPLPENI